MPFWLLLICLPSWGFTQRVMQSPYVALGPALVYVVLALPRLDILMPPLFQTDLEPIRALLATKEGTVIGWMHFLAFDLFVARWCYLDSKQLGIPPYSMSPLFVILLLAGPVGFCVYLALRSVKARRQAPKPA
jgi:hypothetical protein